MSDDKKTYDPFNMEKPAVGPTDDGKEAQPITKDFIPIPLMFAVCFLVILFTVVLMWSNWQTSYTRRQALVALNNKQYDKAIQKYEKLFNQKPSTEEEPELPGAIAKIKPLENPTLLSEVALAYSYKEEYDKALKYYLDAQKFAANLPADDQGNSREAADFSVNIGYVYLQMKQYDESEKYLSQALKKNEKDPRANFIMGELEMERGNYKKAASHFKVVSRDERYQAKVKDYYKQIEEKLFGHIG